MVVFVCEELGISRSFCAYDNLRNECLSTKYQRLISLFCLVFSAYETEQMVSGDYKFEIRVDGETKYSGRFKVEDQEQDGEEKQDG